MPTSRMPHHLGHDWVFLTKAATTRNPDETKLKEFLPRMYAAPLSYLNHDIKVQDIFSPS
jgi:hypothetical protein